MKKLLLIAFMLLTIGVLAQAQNQDENLMFSNELLQQAQSGNVDAQYDLAECYYEGYGIEKDLEKAYFWYSKAADQGDAEAIYSLGWMYMNGEFVAKNFDKGFQLYTTAAEKGSSSAQFAIGELYYDGEQVNKDYEKAYKWFLKAAEQDHDEAQFSLGWMYQHGQGVEEDLNKAKMWYKKAADNEYDDAITELAKIEEKERQEKADAAAIQTAMKKMVGHTYSCSDLDLGGDGAAMFATTGIKLTQSVTFISSKQARLKTQVLLTNSQLKRSQAAQGIKAGFEELLNGTMDISFVEGFVILSNDEGKTVAGFKPDSTNIIVDLYGNSFHKVK